jgi:hypothetical protein
MKAPHLARMVLKDLVRLRDKVEKAIDKRVGRERRCWRTSCAISG